LCFDQKAHLRTFNICGSNSSSEASVALIHQPVVLAAMDRSWHWLFAPLDGPVERGSKPSFRRDPPRLIF